MSEKILAEIKAEREAQDRKYGGAANDDKHGSYDWVAYVTHHLGRAVSWPWDAAEFRKQMIRVAALAVAAVEWADRAQARGTDDAVDEASGEGSSGATGDFGVPDTAGEFG